MAELWGAILGGFGFALDAIFRVVPSYGVAIILLTLVARALIAPLGVKQIKSMQQMQKLQPEVKKLQQKHKGDRQKMNEELMKLYREHGANPLGGCFPLIAQFPVFIALYAVIRAVVPFQAATESPIAQLPKATICTPAGATGDPLVPSVGGEAPAAVSCDIKDGTESFKIKQWSTRVGTAVAQPPSYLARCNVQGTDAFVCASPLGTGHLPKDGKLFRQLVEGKGQFLGMHLACSPNQAGSSNGIRQCTSSAKKAAGPALIMYYLLVLAMAGTTFFQQRQMMKKAPPQQAQQMKVMGVMMPVVLGFFSLQFPAALSVYWITGNIWTIVQQKVIMDRQEAAQAAQPAPKPEPGKKPGGNSKRPGGNSKKPGEKGKGPTKGKG